MRELKFKFLNMSIPVFLVHNEMFNLKETRFLKVETPIIRTLYIWYFDNEGTIQKT